MIHLSVTKKVCKGLSTSKHCVGTVSVSSILVIFLNEFLSFSGNSISWFLIKKGFNPFVEKHISQAIKLFPLNFFVTSKTVDFIPRVPNNLTISSLCHSCPVDITNLFLFGW